MSDLIERENVIDAICDNCKLETNFDRYKACGNCKDVKMIMNIPSAERKGEWIKSETDGFICSACGSGYRDQPTCMGKPMFEYCPVCGAKMKGAEDE